MPASLPDPSTTPLGGRNRQPDQRGRFARNWSGYVPLVRTCPECGTENDQSNRFCVGCAARIDELEASASTNPNSGVRAMQTRLRREAEEARRSRPTIPESGTGMIITGIVLLLVATLFPVPILLRGSLWLAGAGFTAWGLWRMRYDGEAIRRTGYVLALASVGLVALVITRGTPPTDPAILISTTEPTESVMAIATPSASPIPAGLAGSVPTLLGDAGHSGHLEGPPPVQNSTLTWRFDTGNEILAQPIVANGMAFVTNRAGFLHAIDATTGQLRWRTEFGDYALRTTPTVIDDRLYMVAGFTVVALDAATGDTLWEQPIRYAGTASPTVAHGHVYVVSQEGWLYALSIDTGEEVWRASTDGISFGAPSAGPDRLVVATDRGMIVGVNPESGRQAWRRNVESAIYSTPAIVDDTIWLTTADGRLLGLGLDDGGDRFQLEATAELPVTSDSETVYVPSADGGLYAMLTDDSEVQWFASAGGKVRSGPVMSGNQVIIAGGNRVQGFDRATGEQVWYYLAGDQVEAPPAVVDGHVFFGARDGVLYALGPSEADGG